MKANLTGNKLLPTYETGPRFAREAVFNSLIESPLYGDQDPDDFLAHEKPVHRQMQELALQGLDNVEIGKIVGYSAQQVSRVLHQPWARKYMTESAKRSTVDEIRSFLEQEALPSLQVLKSVRDNPQARTSDRVKAADSLADRFLGKATQPITNEPDPTQQTTQELIERLASTGIAVERIGEASPSGEAS